MEFLFLFFSCLLLSAAVVIDSCVELKVSIEFIVIFKSVFWLLRDCGNWLFGPQRHGWPFGRIPVSVSVFSFTRDIDDILVWESSILFIIDVLVNWFFVFWFYGALNNGVDQRATGIYHPFVQFVEWLVYWFLSIDRLFQGFDWTSFHSSVEVAVWVQTRIRL